MVQTIHESADEIKHIYIPPGEQPSLSVEVLASFEEALHRSEGFASYEALRQWLQQTHQVEVKYKTLYTIVRKKFKAKLKVPRPSHTKNPEAIAEFKAACVEQLRAAIPQDNLRPIKLFSQDESRFGLLTIRRRRLTACGLQPVGPVQHRYDWFYLYGAHKWRRLLLAPAKLESAQLPDLFCSRNSNTSLMLLLPMIQPHSNP